ncbi:MAG: helix-turn-helix transcriptional regulator [Actinomycetota bacterium]|nr:helix-turn-helix transcriptional regulator [Actinomycetota bacterium]
MAAERESRGWTIEGLAKRMSDEGCAMTASAIFKIEKGDPPRRIVVDELVAFSRVFEVPVQELLLPPEVAFRGDLVKLAMAYGEAKALEDAAFERWASASAVTAAAQRAIEEHALAHPGLADEALSTLERWTMPQYTDGQMFWLSLHLQDAIRHALAGYPEAEADPDWDYEPDEEDLREMRSGMPAALEAVQELLVKLDDGGRDAANGEHAETE